TQVDSNEIEKKIEQLRISSIALVEKIKIVSSEIVIRTLEEDLNKIETEIKKLEEERKQIGEWKGKAKELDEEIQRLKAQREGTVFKKKFTERLGFRVFAAITAIAGGFLFVFIAAYSMKLAELPGIVQYFQQMAASFGIGSDFSIYFMALIAGALLLPLAIFVFFEKVHKT
ncbi:MAG: hypothetical protein Q8N60_04255, partial [Candidatus Diapherotrites archaeon]|nr:hypothetical protein [Candidatus Diapherotrites archaeon]